MSLEIKKYWFLLPLAILLYGYLFLFRNALIDDTFITLNYVRTLTRSGVWGFYPIHTSNTATSPLNVVLLSLVTLLTRSPFEAVFWLTLIEWILLAVFLSKIGQTLELRWFAPVALVALVLNPLLSSTLGMETLLLATWMVAGLYFFLVRRFDACAIAAGLLTITRPDGLLFMVAIACLMPGWRVRLRTFGIYLATLAPWYLISWVYLGTLIPDTLLIKLRQSWGNFTFVDGIRLYVWRYPVEVYLSGVMLLPALLTLLRPVRQIGAMVWILWLYGLFHFGAYALMRVPPYHWYYAPEVICLILLGALAIARIHKVAHTGQQRVFASALLVLALLVPIAGTAYLVLRAGIPLAESFIQTNWGTHAQYRAIGEYIAEHHAGEVIPTNSEPATIAYYCDCYLVEYTFNVRNWLTEEVKRYRSESSPLDRILQINYLFFKPSAPYPPSTANLKLGPEAEPVAPGTPHWFISTRWSSKRSIVLEPNK